jgi:1-deoxy-D-xylulose-5-phosphate synthase
VIDARFVKPLDARLICAAARRTRRVVTIEDHAGQGGFGSAVLELLAELGHAGPTRCLAVPDVLVEHGDPDQQQHAFGLDAEGIARAVRKLLGKGA